MHHMLALVANDRTKSDFSPSHDNSTVQIKYSEKRADVHGAKKDCRGNNRRTSCAIVGVFFHRRERRASINVMLIDVLNAIVGPSRVENY